MNRILSVFLIVAMAAVVIGCVPGPGDNSANVSSNVDATETDVDATETDVDATETGDDMTETSTSDTAIEAKVAEAKAVEFSVAWCTNEDPKVAAETAVKDAMAGLAGPTKGLIFYEYYPKTIKDAKDEDKEVPDVDKEKAVLPAVSGVAGDVPVIGCRARSLVVGGTMLTNTVAVLAIGGEEISCKAVKAELVTDRKTVGASIADQLADVKDIKIVMALSEMNLSFDTTEGVSVEDFIRAILDKVGKDVTLFGGNCMPNDYETDKAGIQFIGSETLSGHVVAMGIGGPLAVHANHTNEFTPSTETFKVTKAEDKWIYELDGKPANEVFRASRGMAADVEFTEDWQHPIGVIVAEGKVYLRMVLEEDKEKNGLRFVAAVPVGTEIKVLKGGADPKAILEAAREGITESLEKAGDEKPLLALLSDCCARGMRLREFREGEECEIKGAILPAMEAKGAKFPIFGFYAWGELGPIAGEFGGLGCMYQQHTFVSAVITEKK